MGKPGHHGNVSGHPRARNLLVLVPQVWRLLPRLAHDGGSNPRTPRRLLAAAAASLKWGVSGWPSKEAASRSSTSG